MQYATNLSILGETWFDGNNCDHAVKYKHFCAHQARQSDKSVGVSLFYQTNLIV